jgi:hypothetical protein
MTAINIKNLSQKDWYSLQEEINMDTLLEDAALYILDEYKRKLS